MATTKTINTEPKITPAQLKKENKKLKDENQKLKDGAWCYMCDTHKQKAQFYVSTDPMNKSGVTPICKRCAYNIAMRMDKNGDFHEPTRESIQAALKRLNKPFFNDLYDSSIQECENTASGKNKKNVWTSYIKNVAMQNYIGMTWDDSDMFKEKVIYEDEKTPAMVVKTHKGQDIYDDYLKNKDDVVRLLGRDPYENETVTDQPILYSQLLELLDKGGDGNDDMVRNNSAIQIARGFLQLSKLDITITNLMVDSKNIENNAPAIKSLQDSKSKITSMITSLAAESCISLKNNKNAKKGENTWTGKIKKIKELDLRQGRVNGFDIETSKAMRQVMDNSHHSIMNELRLDDSDWSDMVAEQRDMIVNIQKKLDQYIEISRILLTENLDLKDYIEKNNVDIKGYQYVDLEDLYSCFAAENDEDEDRISVLESEA